MKSEHCLYVAGGGISSLIGNTVSGEVYDTVHLEVDSKIDDEVYGTVGDIVGDEVSRLWLLCGLRSSEWYGNEE